MKNRVLIIFSAGVAACLLLLMCGLSFFRSWAPRNELDRPAEPVKIVVQAEPVKVLVPDFQRVPPNNPVKPAVDMEVKRLERLQEQYDAYLQKNQ